MPTPNNNLLQRIAQTLIWGADLIAKDARALAKTGRMKRSIKVSTVKSESETSRSIDVSISEADAPEALAYEFGSGIWGHEGKKYPIRPVNSEFLAFNWPAASEAAAFSREGKELVIPGPGGKVVLPGVMHPGVRPEPYMTPALDKNKAKIVSELADMSVSAIADLIVTEQTVVIS